MSRVVTIEEWEKIYRTHLANNPDVELVTARSPEMEVYDFYTNGEKVASIVEDNEEGSATYTILKEFS